MALNPEFDKIQSTEIVPISVANGIECKLPLTEEEGKEILKVQVVANLTTLECLNREIKYSGRAIFTVLYKSESDIKKLEIGVEFSFKVENEKVLEGMTVIANVNADNVNVEIVNGIVTATAVLCVKGEITKPSEIEYFKKEPTIVTNDQTLEFGYELQKTKKEFKIEDEYEVPILIEKVLCHTEKVCVTNCQCGVGSVIVDGEIEFSALAVLLGDNKEPNVILKKIPFRVEITAPDVLPDLYPSILVELKNSSIKVYVDESKQKSIISIETLIEANCVIYKNTTFIAPVDAYSVENQLNIQKENKKLFKVIGFNYQKESIKTEISFKEVENGRLVSVLNDKIEEVNYLISDNKLKVNGIVSVSALFDGENRIVKESVVKFEIIVPLSADFISNPLLTITDLKVVNNQVEFDVHLSFTAFKEVECLVITQIEEGAKRLVNESAITVYIPLDGETLWDVSKNLGVSEQDILNSNSELQFPLSSEDRIVIYREKDK